MLSAKKIWRTTKRYLSIPWVDGLLKMGLIVLLVWVLYRQLFGRTDISAEQLWATFLDNLSWSKLPLILFVCLLMPLNWLLETKKWLSLLRNIQPIRLRKALKAVMAGVTFSLFTPNRIGEYGGRLLLVEEDKRFLAVIATMIGSFSQWIVLIVGGWWGLVTIGYLGIIPMRPLLLLTLVMVGIGLTFLLLTAYYNLNKVAHLLLRFRWTRSWGKTLQQTIFQHYSSQILHQALFYSFLRYATYSFQYLLLLYFFGFEGQWFVLLLGIAVVYLLQTGIPLPPSTGLLARGNIALLIFGYLSGSATAVLSATFCLWIINVVLPATLGAIFITQKGWKADKSSTVLLEPALIPQKEA